ncbi:CopG family transcriptional regulator [Krasilnikovia sp. MM14-A1259]|uniref:ribbon-helix-helix domain-containing protein n=1 Tax=Krasilnikovia sp. MM14-A1259 TaxID=3373539 RepID=UPI003824D141
MSKHDDAIAALEDRDWSGAQVDNRPRAATVVQSVRFSRDLTERLLAEAERRGVTPSEVIRDLVEAGLTTVDESATVRLADVHRVINTLAQRAADPARITTPPVAS